MPAIRLWFGQAADTPTIGGFLYSTIAAIGLGLLASTCRWLIVDSLHHWTGIRRPSWDFSRLPQTIAAFDRLIEDHFRYYQFHANSLMAICTASILRWVSVGVTFSGVLVTLVIVIILAVGSRDTLSKYYRRVEEVLRRKR